MTEQEKTNDAAPVVAPPPPRGPAAYLGVGCLTAAAGLAGGGMLAVLVAKVVGAATQCTPTVENGAPCNWDMYWTWGARIGVILLPAMALWRMWRSDRKRDSARNSQ